MREVKHKIIHQYQSTATGCSPTAFSTLLTHYNVKMSPEDVMKNVNKSVGEGGHNTGSINQQYATWFIQEGFEVKIVSADVQVLDQSWAQLAPQEQMARMKKRIHGWQVPGIGKSDTQDYTQSYIDFLQAGGDLKIVPYISSGMLYKLLQDGPIVPAVCFSTLHGTGRSKITDGQYIKNDIDGRAPNHTIVVYGHDEDGNFYISDPDQKPGLITVEPEQMVAAIATAQIECDNLVVQISNL